MFKKYRSAVSGRYVTESFTKKNSRETVGEKSKSTRKKKQFSRHKEVPLDPFPGCGGIANRTPNHCA
jgi:hypothetical protein